MSITTKCPTCSREYKFPDQLAGRSTRCNTCGSEFQIPGSAQAPRSAAPTPLKPQYVSPATQEDSARTPQSLPLPLPRAPAPAPAQFRSPRLLTDVSRPQKLAANIALTLGILVFLGGTCVSGSGFLSLYFISNPPPNMRVRASSASAALAAGGGILLLTAAIIYFVSSFKIRRGSVAAARTTLIVAALHEVSVLIWMGYGIVNLVSMGGIPSLPLLLRGGFGILLQLLFAAAIAQMIYYLLKIIRADR